MRLEHIQERLTEATSEESLDMDKWDKVVDIIYSTFREGRITVECE